MEGSPIHSGVEITQIIPRGVVYISAVVCEITNDVGSEIVDVAVVDVCEVLAMWPIERLSVMVEKGYRLSALCIPPALGH